MNWMDAATSAAELSPAWRVPEGTPHASPSAPALLRTGRFWHRGGPSAVCDEAYASGRACG
eukprot:3583777-Amphidinium_carterae.1